MIRNCYNRRDIARLTAMTEVAPLHTRFSKSGMMGAGPDGVQPDIVPEPLPEQRHPSSVGTAGLRPIPRIYPDEVILVRD